MKAHVHLFARKHINTDEIIPARYLNEHDEVELAKHAMEDIDPDFVAKVNVGDVIVAGEDFGCGSSREHAVWALRGAGVRAVIADSLARIFFRNAVNNGFPALEIPGISGRIADGDEIEILLDEGLVRNLTQKEEYSFIPYSPFMKSLMSAGGLLAAIAARETRGRFF